MKHTFRLVTLAVVFLALLAGVAAVLGPTHTSACILVEFCSSSDDCQFWCPSGSGECVRVECKQFCLCS